MLLLVAACGSDPTPTSAPAATATPEPTPEPTVTLAPGEPTRTPVPPTVEPTATLAPTFEQEWEALIAAAQEEGRLVIAAGGSPSREYRPVVTAFGKKFGIQVELSTGSGAATTDRVLAERSFDRYAVDIGLTSVASTRTRLMPAEALDPIPPLLIHPEVLDLSAWSGGQYWWADIPEEEFSFIYAVAPAETLDLWYNTDSISAEEIATIVTASDLLNPKWKGMITSRTWGDRGRVGLIQTIYDQPGLGMDWINAFFAMDVQYSDDLRLREAWVVEGAFPIGLSDGDLDQALFDLMEAGLPVAQHKVPYPSGMLSAGGSGCCIQAYNRAPNPNAAKLFINWWLSKEGQTAVHNVEPRIQRQSLREDIPLGNVTADSIREPGRDYLFRDADPDIAANDATQRDQIVEAFDASTR
jgi:iron(III) transport system substrate-binding protein